MYYRERLEFAIRNPFVKLLGFLVAFFLFGWLIYSLRGVLTPVLLSLLIAYLLDPVVDRFERRGVSRTVAILILLVLLFIGASLMIFLIALAVRDLVDVIKNDLPAWLDHQVLPWLNGVALPWISRTFDLDLTESGEASMVSGALAELRANLTRLVPHLTSPARLILTSALSGTMALLAWAGTAIMVPLLSFYLLRDFDLITARARALIPRSYEEQVVKTFKEIDTTLAAFLRGQFLVMLVLGLLYGTGLTIARVKMGFGIGLLAGMLNFIPYLGFVIGIGMALIMSLLGGDNIWWNLLGTGITFGVVQALEGTVITPKIVGDKVGLHPVWVIVAVLAGASLMGVTGMLLAIPLAAVAKIIMRHAMAKYRESYFYTRRDRDEHEAERELELEAAVEQEAAVEHEHEHEHEHEAEEVPVVAPPEPEAPHAPAPDADEEAPTVARAGGGRESPKTMPLHPHPEIVKQKGDEGDDDEG